MAPSASVTISSRAVDFIDAVARGDSDVAVIDPTLAEQDRRIPESLARAHLGTVLYIKLTPDYAQASVKLIREVGSGEIVTYDYSDDPVAFAAALRRQSRATRGQFLLRALGPQIAALPPALQDGVHRMSDEGERVYSVERLASVCDMGRGTLWRHFKRAGINSPWGFVVGLALLRNYDALINDSLAKQGIAKAIGVSSRRELQHQLTAVTGLSLSEILAPISIDRLAGCIAAVLTKP
jgi:AraC-like DNA-binding protein